jgi:DNA-binding NarL/FixJ family response regulator
VRNHPGPAEGWLAPGAQLEGTINKTSRVRVLVVGDFKTWLRSMTETLSSESGVQVVGTALDGPEAIAQAQSLRPDLVLMDVGLPGMSGIQTAWKIVSLIPTIKILFVSLSSDREIVQAAFAVGGHGCITKPNAYGELLVAIKVVLAGKRYVDCDLPGFNATQALDT